MTNLIISEIIRIDCKVDICSIWSIWPFFCWNISSVIISHMMIALKIKNSHRTLVIGKFLPPKIAHMENRSHHYVWYNRFNEITSIKCIKVGGLKMLIYTFIGKVLKMWNLVFISLNIDLLSIWFWKIYDSKLAVIFYS